MALYVNLLSSENVVFKTYAFYSVVLIVKTMMMSLLTALQRYRKKTLILFPSALPDRVTVIDTIQNQIQKTKFTIRDRVSKLKDNNCFKYFTKVFVSPEDLSLGQTGDVKYDDPDVERIRRAHLNDLENIPIFLITGLLFVLSNPNELLAMMLFRLYTVFRILHTVVYTMIIVRQPARSIMFMGGLTINLIMCVLIATKFLHF